MDVPVQRDGGVRMAEHLAEAFELELHLDAAGRKGVPERVKMHTLQPAVPRGLLMELDQRDSAGKPLRRVIDDRTEHDHHILGCFLGRDRLCPTAPI